MKKTFGDILDRMTQLLVEMGFKYAEINRSPKIVRTQGLVFERSVHVEKDNLTLEVAVKAIPKADQGGMNTYNSASDYKYSNSYHSYQQRRSPSIPKRHYLRYNWFIEFRVFIQDNNHNLTLKIQKESFKNKVGKLFGKRDLEVYNESFDKLFWVEGNNPYAHATILDDTLQQKLIDQVDFFHELEVRKQGVRYKEPKLKRANLRRKDFKRHYRTMMEVCLSLGENINQWRPPIEE